MGTLNARYYALDYNSFPRKTATLIQLNDIIEVASNDHLLIDICKNNSYLCVR